MDGPPPTEADHDLGHTEWIDSHHKGGAGPLERMKESAVHAVEGVKMRLHLSGSGGGGTHQPSAEERTGEGGVCWGGVG